jgi:hypothetical protein
MSFRGQGTGFFGKLRTRLGRPGKARHGMRKGEDMRILIAAILLLIVGCTGVAHANQQATEDQDRIAQLEEQVALLFEEAKVHEEHILNLEEQVALLFEEAKVHEEHILALEAHDEAKVVQVVRDHLWERVTSCNLDDCFDGDAVLWAFKHLPMSNYDKITYVMTLVGGGYWYGESVSATSWRVYAQYDKDTEPWVFLIDTTYHLICWEGLTHCQKVAGVQ